jgi:DNA-binding response OmpR family regulator
LTLETKSATQHETAVEAMKLGVDYLPKPFMPKTGAPPRVAAWRRTRSDGKSPFAVAGGTGRPENVNQRERSDFSFDQNSTQSQCKRRSADRNCASSLWPGLMLM